MRQALAEAKAVADSERERHRPVVTVARRQGDHIGTKASLYPQHGPRPGIQGCSVGVAPGHDQHVPPCAARCSLQTASTRACAASAPATSSTRSRAT